MAHIAGLPMYDFPELAGDNDALWNKIAAELTAAGVEGVPETLTRDISHLELWRHPGLLLAQACEYPLATGFGGSVRLIATPRYHAPGCANMLYRSAIVVRAADDRADLSGFRGSKCVVNEPSSNSGMNLLRAAVAPLADGRPFFQSVTVSGSHRRSLGMVAGGEADIAAIDCVTLAHLRKFAPAEVASVRVLGWTQASPSLPFITARTTDEATIAAIRSALRAAIADPALEPARANLFLEGFDFAPDESFATVLELEQRAAGLRYPRLE
jgi:ABC-type phosphate/phosphonate transport system substrate-binding protein